MSDDVDDLLRRAMATLDRQVPSGYFDALPDRTLARLGDPASRQTRGRGRTAAIVGIGLAAAAGVVIFLTARGRDRADMAARPGGGAIVAAESPSAAPARAPAVSVSGAPASPADSEAGLNELTRNRAEAPAPPSSALSGSAAVAHGAVAEPDAPRKIAVAATKRSDDKRAVSKGAAALAEPQAREELEGQGVAAGVSSGSASRQAPRRGAGKPAGGAGSGADQPPLDELIGQGGAAGAKAQRPVKSKAGRASLSTDDIERGMTAVAARVRACYAGPQAVALRVTVAPSGQVAKVTVTGPFAGAPVGTCVERAVAAARFPPRDGGPRSFGYSYLLSD